MLARLGIAAVLGTLGTAALSTPALADEDDHGWWHHHHEWREHEWREHEWREHGRWAYPGYYGGYGYGYGYAPPAGSYGYRYYAPVYPYRRW